MNSLVDGIALQHIILQNISCPKLVEERMSIFLAEWNYAYTDSDLNG